MAVGILIITHDNVGTALLDNATATLGFCPLDAEVINVSRDCDTDKVTELVRRHHQQLQQGDGVLILTDIFGSTPSNIACTLKNESLTSVVAELNLPMLIRVLNYPNLSLPELVEKALSGGREGILECPSN